MPTATPRRFTLEEIIWPPPLPLHSETESERQARIESELEARRTSDSIDSIISAEKESRKKKPPVIKVLLLGQAEAGKSSVLKNLQIYFAPKAFRAEVA